MKWASGLRVLVVDDEPEFTRAVEKALLDMGFQVEIAIDGGEAIRCLLAHVPDLVCVNLSLPRDSGYDVCELIRGDESFKAVRILVMSDRHSPEDIAYAEEAGANAFLKRPFSLKLLTDYVEALFDNRAPKRSTLRTLRPNPPPAAE